MPDCGKSEFCNVGFSHEGYRHLKILAVGGDNIYDVGGKKGRETVGDVETDFRVKVQVDSFSVILYFVDSDDF